MQSQSFTQNQNMHSQTYEIYYYREAVGPDIAVHHHSFYEVYQLLSGDVSMWVDGRIYPMQRGDILLIHPQALHRPIIHPGSDVYERIVLWIKNDYVLSLSDDFTNLTDCFAQTVPWQQNLIRADHDDAQITAVGNHLMTLVNETQSSALGAQLYANGIFLQFMVELNRVMAKRCTEEPGCTNLTKPDRNRYGSNTADTIAVPKTPISAAAIPEDRSDAGQNAALVSRILAYIGDHCHETLTLDRIADSFFISKYHLSHTFSREVGIPVYRYITIRRLMLAKQLLECGIPAGEVCYRAGFNDYAGFYRAFKAEYGVSPREIIH